MNLCPLDAMPFESADLERPMAAPVHRKNTSLDLRQLS
jgi:hypothetical protein